MATGNAADFGKEPSVKGHILQPGNSLHLVRIPSSLFPAPTVAGDFVAPVYEGMILLCFPIRRAH